MEFLKRLAQRLYQFGNKISFGALDILRIAVQNFTLSQAAEAAASISYYAIFSLFPLLLVIITIGSFFFESGSQAADQLSRIMLNAIPISRNLIEVNIQTVLRTRGTIGIIGIIALLWSGTSVFTILSININRSFPQASRRNFVQSRVTGLIIAVLLTFLLVIAFLLRALLGLVPVLNIPFIQRTPLFDSALWGILTNIVPWFLIFFAFLSLYRFIPNTYVKWSQGFWGALLSASVWTIFTTLFSWYVGSGLARFELIYGSLGALIALMFYIYLTSWITLFGAHLTAAIKKTQEAPTGMDKPA